MGRRYAGRHIDAVYCSDLRRARDTAAIAFERGGLVLVDERLRELDYGEWTGRPRAEVAAERIRRIADPFPGGESVAQAAERIRAFLRDLLARHEGETILVIGHSATHFGLEHWLNGTPLDQIVAAPWTFGTGRSYALTEDALARIMADSRGGHRDP